MKLIAIVVKVPDDIDIFEVQDELVEAEHAGWDEESITVYATVEALLDDFGHSLDYKCDAAVV